MNRPFNPRQFDEMALKPNGITKAFGVPDSSIKGFLTYLSVTKPLSEHIGMASEGGAVALAAGHYLSSQKLALVYMQNSGLAHALNPLQSLAAKEVFGIPMLLMIGWRGKPGEKDEPQHASIGPRTLGNLKANDIIYEEIPDTLSGAKECIARLVSKAYEGNTPVALIVPRETFLEYDHVALQSPSPALAVHHANLERFTSAAPEDPLSRELAIRCVLGHIQKTDLTVCSLGGSTRELYMIRKESKQSIERDFLCMGAMGHTFALAHGIAMGFPSGRVFCIDGDGSFLMHVGNNAVLSGISYWDVVHVVIYNGVYNSTGNQPLAINKDSFLAMAEGLPYKHKILTDNMKTLEKVCDSARNSTLIIVVVNDSVRAKLPRPSESPQDLKKHFMRSFL